MTVGVEMMHRQVIKGPRILHIYTAVAQSESVIHRSLDAVVGGGVWLLITAGSAIMQTSDKSYVYACIAIIIFIYLAVLM